MGKASILVHSLNDDNDHYEYYQFMIIMLFGFVILRLLIINCCNLKNLCKSKHKNYEKIQFNSETEYFDSCTICLEDFNDKEKLLKLDCNHVYHEHCIKTWFKKKKKCPNCANSFSSVESISPISQESRSIV